VTYLSLSPGNNFLSLFRLSIFSVLFSAGVRSLFDILSPFFRFIFFYACDYSLVSPVFRPKHFLQSGFELRCPSPLNIWILFPPCNILPFLGSGVVFLFSHFLVLRGFVNPPPVTLPPDSVCLFDFWTVSSFTVEFFSWSFDVVWYPS